MLAAPASGSNEHRCERDADNRSATDETDEVIGTVKVAICWKEIALNRPSVIIAQGISSSHAPWMAVRASGSLRSKVPFDARAGQFREPRPTVVHYFRASRRLVRNKQQFSSSPIGHSSPLPVRRAH